MHSPKGFDRLAITETAELDAAVAAALHLFGAGLPPIFDLPTIRALWRRNRPLAMTLARIRGVTE